MDVDQPSSSKAATAQGKKPRYAYAGGNQLSSEAREELMKKGLCFKCQKMGHRAFDTKETPTGRKFEFKFVCPARASEVPKGK